MKIFLIGFMGSGKSYTGRRLAALLQWSFLDLDELIEKRAGNTISEIFAASGEEAFRELERESLRSLDAEDHLVIATGGGTPCFADNMEWMNANGLTIYLTATTELLENRLQGGREHRPIISNFSGKALVELVRQKMAEREPYYRKAAVVYTQSGDEDVARALFDHMPELRKAGGE